MPSSWLDEIGTKHGFYRFENEDYRAYRRRIVDHLRRPPDVSERSYLYTLNRNVGLEAFDLLEIDLKTVWDDDLQENALVAPDPHIEIDSSFLRIWRDYNGGETPVVELNLQHQDEAYFLEDILPVFNDLDFLEVKALVNLDDWKYKKSSHLAYGNTRRRVQNHTLVKTRVNFLSHKYIVDVSFTNNVVWANERRDIDYSNLDTNGDYHIDYVDGIVVGKIGARGSCHYVYRDFPYKLSWQPVRAYPFNDKSILELINDKIINEDGLEERLLLNSSGAKIVNEILSIHPLQWGK